MKPEQRPAVAAICASLVNGARYRAALDAETQAITKLTVETGGEVKAYDHARACHLVGPPESVFDHGRGKHLHFEAAGQVVSGYDYGSERHFRAEVNGSQVVLYDYEDETHHRFAVG